MKSENNFYFKVDRENFNISIVILEILDNSIAPKLFYLLGAPILFSPIVYLIILWNEVVIEASFYILDYCTQAQKRRTQHKGLICRARAYMSLHVQSRTQHMCMGFMYRGVQSIGVEGVHVQRSTQKSFIYIGVFRQRWVLVKRRAQAQKATQIGTEGAHSIEASFPRMKGIHLFRLQ